MPDAPSPNNQERATIDPSESLLPALVKLHDSPAQFAEIAASGGWFGGGVPPLDTNATE